MKKGQYIVAVKDSTGPGPIKPGKVLGKYKKKENAERDFQKLAARECGWDRVWHVGIFHEGRLV